MSVVDSIQRTSSLFCSTINLIARVCNFDLSKYQTIMHESGPICQPFSVSGKRDGLEGEDRDLWRAVEADGDVHGADAAADEDRGVLAAAHPGDHRELPGGDRADAGEDDLPAVRMPAQHQRHR